MKDYIGALVKRFESGTKGSLALSSCGNDWGLSCGSYQLTLRWGNCIKFLQKYFPDKAKSLYFNSGKQDLTIKYWPGKDYCSSPDDVRKVWTECYNMVGAEKFFEYEHDHIQHNYYEPLMQRLGTYFNPNRHSRMMQECLWSWAVHRGSYGAYKEFKEVCAEKGIQPQKVPADTLIDIVYDKRFNMHGTTRYKKNAGASSERETLRSYCNVSPLPYNGTNPSMAADVTNIDTTVSTQPVAPTVTPAWYRIGSGWKNGKCVDQTGAYSDLEIAKKNCKEGQNIYDEKGNIVYSGAVKQAPAFEPYIIKVTASSLNVRSGPGTNNKVVTSIKSGYKFTIVAEQMVGSTKWGRLKSGAGWISLDFTVRV